MPERGAIRRVEELSQNAWPPLQTMLLDGWVLRFSDGYTKRANSVSPLYRGMVGAERKASICEEAYSTRGLDTVFKLTAASVPANLGRILSERGYRRVGGASVQTLRLRGRTWPSTGAVETSEVLSERWLSAYFEMSGVDPRMRETARKMLLNTVPRKLFASVAEGDKVVACGMGVAEDAHIGIFDVVTHPDHRRRGHARALVLSLLRWGEQAGAGTGYLQVEPDNGPAVALYQGIGFSEAYPYWYMVKARPGAVERTEAGREIRARDSVRHGGPARPPQLPGRGSGRSRRLLKP
ncbi:MAG: GNAT family N-acetyltransferase [Nitrososphaerota archaeon]|nr:GNAT family N-acetyltransferase [Nitrososphaerota archaeon]MDG6946149.1 GNAT family N-acetyltransferase [Nitrososphaerota archaeon]